MWRIRVNVYKRIRLFGNACLNSFRGRLKKDFKKVSIVSTLLLYNRVPFEKNTRRKEKIFMELIFSSSFFLKNMKGKYFSLAI